MNNKTGINNILLLFLVIATCCGSGTRALEVCETEACQAIATTILSSMDPSTNPCQDFYQFACGKFVDSAKIPDDQTEDSFTFQIVSRVQNQLKTIVEEKSNATDPLPYRNVRQLFSLCMDEYSLNARGLSPGLAKLQELGGWPVLGDWDEKNWDFLDTEIKMSNILDEGGNFIDVMVLRDSKNSSRRAITVDQANLGLDRGILINGMNDPTVQAYYSYMVDIAVMFGADNATASEQLRECLLFEIELANITSTSEERRDLNRIYNPFSLQNLKAEISWVDWNKLLNRTMPADVPIQENELIIVVEVEYLKKLENLLKKYQKRVLANYMMWHAAMSLSSLLTDAMRNRSQEYDNALEGSTSREPRWKECVDVTQDSLDIALSSLYVKTFFDKSTKEDAIDMFNSINQEMQIVVQEVDWMDVATRERALEKIKKLIGEVGYPDELVNVSKIENYYNGLQMGEEPYFEEMLKLRLWTRDYGLRQLREPVDRDDWREHSDVAVVNAFYYGVENSIELPAGILQQPFFDPSFPKYVNYGATGTTLGHESTHSLDDVGRNFNYKGELEEWWTGISRKVFDVKKKCFIDQYSSFVDETTHLHLNGNETQGENIADNGGIKVAYRAYQRLNISEPPLPGLQNYTAEQLFVISYGISWCTKYRPEELKYLITTDPHPPAQFRVNGPLKNFPEFSRIFSCSANDAMNPQDKCAVW